jgi:hypothetical protein
MVLDSHCGPLPDLEKAPALRIQYGDRPHSLRLVWKSSVKTSGGALAAMLDQYGDRHADQDTDGLLISIGTLDGKFCFRGCPAAIR